jgi:hypothetical protein
MLPLLLFQKNCGQAVNYIISQQSISLDIFGDSLLQTILFVCLDFGPGQLTSFMLNLRCEAGFFKPTVLIVHHPISGIKAHVTMPGRLEHSFHYLFLLHDFDPNEWCIKKGISHESSALTPRPVVLSLF